MEGDQFMTSHRNSYGRKNGNFSNSRSNSNSNVTFNDGSFQLEKSPNMEQFLIASPVDLTKATPFFDSAANKQTMSHREKKLHAVVEVAQVGANNLKNRVLCELYSAQTLVKAAEVLPPSKKIDLHVAKEMEKVCQKANSPDQVMVMSRRNQTQWKYVNQDEHGKRMLNCLKMENGGREISSLK